MKDFFDCEQCVNLLLDYIENNLDPAAREDLEEHLSACPPCLHFLQDYRSCTELARKLRDQEVQVPSEMQFRLKSFLKERLKT